MKLAKKSTTSSKPVKPAKVTATKAKVKSVPKPAPAGRASVKKTAVKQAAPRKVAVKPAAPLRQRPGNPPAILLEGDEVDIPVVSGPDERFTPEPPVAATPPVLEAAPPELPASYDTGRLFLTPRDPRWLYMHWDFSAEALERLRAEAVDHSLRLRLYAGGTDGELLAEVVLPEDRGSRFEQAGRPGTRHVAQLGTYDAQHQWRVVATSGPVETPVDSPVAGNGVRFETLPAEVSLKELADAAEQAGLADKPLLEVIHTLQGGGQPVASPVEPAQFSPERTAALASASRGEEARRISLGSLELVELLRQQLARGSAGVGAMELSSAGLAALPPSPGVLPGVVPAPGAESSQAAGFGGAEEEKQFWFNINAELIIYGATEPTAKVTLAGRRIRLRPDGTFSYRFALPDGRYELEAVAVSADGTDGRSANLQFSRATEYQGMVDAHPQDPRLKPPHSRHVEAAA